MSDPSRRSPLLSPALVAATCALYAGGALSRRWIDDDGFINLRIARNLLDSVNKRSQLEEHVINIGLSNNYFKNIAEIFKKELA